MRFRILYRPAAKPLWREYFDRHRQSEFDFWEWWTLGTFLQPQLHNREAGRVSHSIRRHRRCRPGKRCSSSLGLPRFAKSVLVLDIYPAAIRKNFQTQMAEYFHCRELPSALSELLPRLRASRSTGSINARALSSDPLRRQYGRSP